MYGDWNRNQPDAGHGRTYMIFIHAEDAEGNSLEFTEIVEYPRRRRDATGCVHESEREATGVDQVCQRMPHLKKVHAKGSIGL